MSMSGEAMNELARRILAAADAGGSIKPVTSQPDALELEDAYDVSARIAMLRETRGERRIGWKIGFTNRTIWDEYGVHAPIWGPMYSTTLAAIDDPACEYVWPLGKLVEPRIEPEIAFRMSAAPSPEMDERALLDCIDGVAHGFEIVQSIFPGWIFKAADTVAAFALHGAYRHGPFAILPSLAQRDEWFARLRRFEIALLCDGEEIDRGVAVNVLDGPLSALRHFVRGLEDDPLRRKLRAGDVVTTGTVTRAFPVCAGERWSTRVVGLPLAGLAVRFA